jgi:Bacterial Ig domain/Fibronectin type III domain
VKLALLLATMATMVALVATPSAVGRPSDLPAPTGLKVTGTQTTGVFLNWDDYSAFVEDGYILEVADANGTVLNTIDQTTAANSDYWVSNLTPDTTYQFRVRAYDTQPDGTRVYSDWTARVSADTDPVAPPPSGLPAPTGLKVTGTQTTGVFLNWDDYLAFVRDGYILEVADANGTVLNTIDQTTAANSDYWVSNLTPDTTYQFRVRAYDTQPDGTRVYSDWTARVSAHTDPVAPPTPPPPDTTPPTVRLTAPANGANITGTTTLSAVASDDTAVDHVLFRVDGNTVNTDSSAPYSYLWDSTSVADGSHSVTALAVDTAGNSTPSLAADVTVDNAPPPPSPSCSNPPCWDFAGNTFSGTNLNHVQSLAMDMAVSPDGLAIAGADWVESAHDVRTYTSTGQATGPRPGNSSGRFRENGGGPRAVAATSTGLYAAQARNIIRWDKATWLSYGASGATYDGATLTLPGSGDLVGLVACGTDAYVTDAGVSIGEQGVSPDTAQIKAVNGNMTGGVLRQWTVPRARKLACDRQGNVWVLQQRTSTASARLSRWSPSGSQLAAWDVSGDPMDVAADPNADQVLIADNGSDQDVERYDYTGNLVGRLGVQGGYLAGPTPGLLDKNRFAGPRGVDVDSAGNVYVMQTLNPNRGVRGWNEGGGQMILSKLTPSGSESYRVWGQSGMPGMASDDGSRFYDGDLTYAKSGGVWKPFALNMDGFSGADPEMDTPNLNIASVTRATQEREVSGHRLLAQSGANTDYLRVYRFDGELRRICKSFGGARDYTLADNGDVWRVADPAGTGARVTRFARNGWDASGCPAYDAGTTMPASPGISDPHRIAVDGTTVYVMGYNADFLFESGFDDWKFSGKLVARFNGLPTSSGWPTQAWRIAVPWSTYPDRPTSMDASGSWVAVAYLGGGAGVGQGHIRVFNSANGSLVSDLVPPASLLGPLYGWNDMLKSITMKNGLISDEGNGQDKTILITLP